MTGIVLSLARLLKMNLSKYQIPEWQKRLHRKKSLVIGDSRVWDLQHPEMSNLYKGSCKSVNGLRLEKLESLIDEAFKEAKYDNLILVVFFWDFMAMQPWPVDPSVKILKPMPIDTKRIKMLVEYALKLDNKYKILYPELNIVWTIPYNPDLFKYNSSLVAKSTHKNELSMEEMIFFQEYFKKILYSFVNTWQEHTSISILSLNHLCLDGDGAVSTSDGLHPSPKTATKFWFQVFRFIYENNKTEEKSYLENSSNIHLPSQERSRTGSTNSGSSLKSPKPKNDFPSSTGTSVQSQNLPVDSVQPSTSYGLGKESFLNSGHETKETNYSKSKLDYVWDEFVSSIEYNEKSEANESHISPSKPGSESLYTKALVHTSSVNPLFVPQKTHSGSHHLSSSNYFGTSSSQKVLQHSNDEDKSFGSQTSYLHLEERSIRGHIESREREKKFDEESSVSTPSCHYSQQYQFKYPSVPDFNAGCFKKSDCSPDNGSKYPQIPAAEPLPITTSTIHHSSYNQRRDSIQSQTSFTSLHPKVLAESSLQASEKLGESNQENIKHTLSSSSEVEKELMHKQQEKPLKTSENVEKSLPSSNTDSLKEEIQKNLNKILVDGDLSKSILDLLKTLRLPLGTDANKEIPSISEKSVTVNSPETSSLHQKRNVFTSNLIQEKLSDLNKPEEKLSCLSWKQKEYLRPTQKMQEPSILEEQERSTAEDKLNYQKMKASSSLEAQRHLPHFVLDPKNSSCAEEPRKQSVDTFSQVRKMPMKGDDNVEVGAYAPEAIQSQHSMESDMQLVRNASASKRVDSCCKTYKRFYVIGKKFLISHLSNLDIEGFTMINHNLSNLGEKDVTSVMKQIKISPNTICILALSLSVFAETLSVSPACEKFECKEIVPTKNLRYSLKKRPQPYHTMDTNEHSHSCILKRLNEVKNFVSKMSEHVPTIVLPLCPSKVICDDAISIRMHSISHTLTGHDIYCLYGSEDFWTFNLNIMEEEWNKFLKTNHESFLTSILVDNYISAEDKTFSVMASSEELDWKDEEYYNISAWRKFSEVLLQTIARDTTMNTSDFADWKLHKKDNSTSATEKNNTSSVSGSCKGVVKVSNFTNSIPDDFFKDLCQAIDPKACLRKVQDYYLIELDGKFASLVTKQLNDYKIGDSRLKTSLVEQGKSVARVDSFYKKLLNSALTLTAKKWSNQIMENIIQQYCKEPQKNMYKTTLCLRRCKNNNNKCVFYHGPGDRRRLPSKYSYSTRICPTHQCRDFPCLQGLKCKFSHNINEQIYHPAKLNTIICPENVKKQCDKGDYCPYAHKYTPEMFYTHDWQDLSMFGISKSFEFFAGALRETSKLQSVSEVKIFLISTSSYLLTMAQKIFEKIPNSSRLSCITLGDETINPNEYNVFLATPSVILNHERLLSSISSHGVFIVDDIAGILVNDETRDYFLKVWEQLKKSIKESDFGSMNKIFVSYYYDDQLTKNLTTLLQIPLVQENESAQQLKSSEKKDSHETAEEKNSHKTAEQKNSHKTAEQKNSHKAAEQKDSQKTAPPQEITPLSLDKKRRRSRSSSPSKSRRSRLSRSPNRGKSHHAKSRSPVSRKGRREESERKRKSRSRSRGRRHSRSRSRGRRQSRSRSRGRRQSRSRSRGRRQSRSRSRGRRRSRSRSRGRQHQSRSPKPSRRYSRSSPKENRDSSQKTSSNSSVTKLKAETPPGSPLNTLSSSEALLTPLAASNSKVLKNKADESEAVVSSTTTSCPQTQRALFLEAEKKLKRAHEDEYATYVNFPEVHPEYDVCYKKFADEYLKKCGANYDERQRDEEFNKFWVSFCETKKTQMWKEKRTALVNEYKEKSLQLFQQKSKEPSASTPDESHVKFSVEGALNLLEELSDKQGVLGPAILSIIKTTRELGANTPKGLSVFADPENSMIVKMVVEKFKVLKLTSPPGLGLALTRVVDWVEELLRLAEKVKQPSIEDLNLEAIAKESLGKDSSFILRALKSAISTEGIPDVPKEKINELYMKICSIHFNLQMG